MKSNFANKKPSYLPKEWTGPLPWKEAEGGLSKFASSSPKQSEAITAEGETSTLWIAERTGKRHDNVMRDVRTLAAELEIPTGDLLKFAGIYLDSMNRQQDCYLLPFDIAHVLLIRYSAALGMVIVKEWKALHEGRMQPQGAEHVAQVSRKALRDIEASEYIKRIEATGKVVTNADWRMARKP